MTYADFNTEIEYSEKFAPMTFEDALNRIEKSENNKEIDFAYKQIEKLALQTNYVPAILFMADSSEMAEDEKSAAKWYKKAADLGDNEAAFKYGKKRRDGIGVRKEYFEGSYYIELAASRGHGEALYEIGRRYQNGLSRGRAIDAYRKAYQAGFIPAKEKIKELHSTLMPPKESGKIPWEIGGEVNCADPLGPTCVANECVVRREQCPISLQFEGTHILAAEYDAERAKEVYEKALSIAPKYAYCWSLLGDAYEKLGDNKNELKAREKALELCPGVDAYCGMARYYRLKRDFKRARKFLDLVKTENEEKFKLELEALEEAETGKKKIKSFEDMEPPAWLFNSNDDLF